MNPFRGKHGALLATVLLFTLLADIACGKSAGAMVPAGIDCETVDLFAGPDDDGASLHAGMTPGEWPADCERYWTGSSFMPLQAVTRLEHLGFLSNRPTGPPPAYQPDPAAASRRLS